jgi:hypothetical protein
MTRGTVRRRGGSAAAAVGDRTGVAAMGFWRRSGARTSRGKLGENPLMGGAHTESNCH